MIVSENDQEVTFANFRHRNRFWLATWRRQDIPQASAFFLRFSAGVPFVALAHAQERFRFQEGLRLIAQDGSNEKDRVRDVIVSWESAYTVGDGFNIRRTIRRNYPLVGRFLSTEASVQENTLGNGVAREMTGLDLQLSPAESGALFAENIRASSQSGYSIVYRLFSMNCATQMFAILDRVMTAEKTQLVYSPPPFRVAKALDPVEGPSIAALVERKIVPASEPVRSINLEFHLAIGQ